MQPSPVVQQDADGDAQFLRHRVGFSPVQVFRAHVFDGINQRERGLLAGEAFFFLPAQ